MYVIVTTIIEYYYYITVIMFEVDNTQKNINMTSLRAPLTIFY